MYIYASELDTTSVDPFLDTAVRLSLPRTTWPQRRSSSPLKPSWFQRLALRVAAFAFNDQRHVNFALIQTVQELLVMNREKHRAIITAQSEVCELEKRLLQIEEPQDSLQRAT